MLLMLGAVIAFIAIIGGFKFFQIKSAMAGMSYQPPPEAVTTVGARQEDWNSTLKAIGTVAAVQGVTVSADLPGVVEQIDFDSGRPVSKGQVLVVLDAKQERAQLASAEAQRELDRVNLNRMRGMMAAKIIPEATYDAAAAEAKQADAKVAELNATIARKTIRAPFDGVLGLREINLGQYLAGGAAIVSLQSLRPVYVNFSVPQQEMSHLGVGSDIEVDGRKILESNSGRTMALRAGEGEWRDAIRPHWIGEDVHAVELNQRRRMIDERDAQLALPDAPWRRRTASRVGPFVPGSAVASQHPLDERLLVLPAAGRIAEALSIEVIADRTAIAGRGDESALDRRCGCGRAGSDDDRLCGAAHGDIS